MSQTISESVPTIAESISKIRFKSLKIENFKAIDMLDLKFPEPFMLKDPDVFAMGSKNGIGKTSILEACSLVFLCILLGPNISRYLAPRRAIKNEFVRSGTGKAQLSAIVTINDKSVRVEVIITATEIIPRWSKNGEEIFQKVRNRDYDLTQTIDKIMPSLLGHNAEPLVVPYFIYLNSYRKIQEGSIELSRLVDDRARYRAPESRYRSSEQTISTFKTEVLNLLLSSVGLFELERGDEKASVALERLNELIEKYAGGTLDKLRPSLENTLEFRVTPTNGGASFSFDGLSSGQKEIIATFFLIWHYTRKQPSIVLIDEPELHLNPEWQLGFVRQLYKLAPHNQYIVATHSRDIFASVDKKHRILLIPDED